MIKFYCKHCGQKISVPESRAGKKGKCPECKNIVAIPKEEDLQPAASQSNSSSLEISPKSSDLDPAIFDIPTTFRPFLLIGSISSTFFPYCGLALIFCGVALIAKNVVNMKEPAVSAFLLRSAGTYLALVAAHLLGRFYWRYQEKLHWEA